MLVAVVVIYADRAAGQGRRLRFVDLEALQEMRQFTSVGGSRYDRRSDISTPGRALAFLPKGLALLPVRALSLDHPQPAPGGDAAGDACSSIPWCRRCWWGARDLLRTRAPAALMLLLITPSLTLGYALGGGQRGRGLPPPGAGAGVPAHLRGPPVLRRAVARGLPWASRWRRPF